MAQLSDDCFAFGGPMMSVDEAVGIIASRVTAVPEAETVALANADGRALAHDVTAPTPAVGFLASALRPPLPRHPCPSPAVKGLAVSSRYLPQRHEQAFAVT